MPANNTRILQPDILQKLKMKYVIKYDDVNDKIIVTLNTCKRITEHDGDKPFHINAKKYNRKVCFNMTTIEIWKELVQENATKDVSLFDVQNATTMLKVMYQPITKDRVVHLLKHKFTGIKEI